MTIEDIAVTTTGGELRAADLAPLRTVQHGDPDGIPLVAVHTWFKEAAKYERLAALLPGFRIISVLAPDAEQATQLHTLDDWVSFHVSAIRDLGLAEVNIIGWSFGGAVATEVARRLLDDGVRLGYVGLIDSFRPTTEYLRPTSYRRWAWRIAGETALLPPGRPRSSYVAFRTGRLLFCRFPRSGMAIVKTMHRAGRARSVPARVPGPAPTSDLLKLSIRSAARSYGGGAITFPVWLYETAPTAKKVIVPVLGWAGRLHAGYRISPIAGDHFSLWDEANLPSLGRAMHDDLVRVAVHR
jgi:thioesterase domain-containing protein